MSTSVSDKESPRGVGDGASVLGFTSSLLSTLKSSQYKFDDWVQTQRERADAAAAAHNDLVEAQRAEIEGLENELEAIRANLGVGGSGGAGEDNDEAAEAKGGANDGSIARQREQMKQRQAEIERSIADLHLRQGEKQRELEGEFFLHCARYPFQSDVLCLERRNTLLPVGARFSEIPAQHFSHKFSPKYVLSEHQIVRIGLQCCCRNIIRIDLTDLNQK